MIVQINSWVHLWCKNDELRGGIGGSAGPHPRPVLLQAGQGLQLPHAGMKNDELRGGVGGSAGSHPRSVLLQAGQGLQLPYAGENDESYYFQKFCVRNIICFHY